MNRKAGLVWVGIALAGSVVAEPLELTASKDTFGRSNERNRNSGGNEHLLIAHAPSVRSLVAFDLSGVTNVIRGAELRFRPHKSSASSVSIVVASMVNTPNNAAWGEGRGNLGVQGENSQTGEASYSFSAFRDVPWESARGVPVVNLADSTLWNTPFTQLKGVTWEEDVWIRIPIQDVEMLEKSRNSKTQSITFGVWGSAGSGFYFMSSRNSPWPPQLVLDLKD